MEKEPDSYILIHFLIVLKYPFFSFTFYFVNNITQHNTTNTHKSNISTNNTNQSNKYTDLKNIYVQSIVKIKCFLYQTNKLKFKKKKRHLNLN